MFKWLARKILYEEIFNYEMDLSEKNRIEEINNILEDENRKLREDNTKIKSENERLRSENERLKKYYNFGQIPSDEIKIKVLSEIGKDRKISDLENRYNNLLNQRAQQAAYSSCCQFNSFYGFGGYGFNFGRYF